MKLNLRMKVLSPISHFGDERMGTMQTMRTMKFKYNDEFVDAPVFTGNAFRGELRRIAMKDYLDHIGITKEGITAKMYYLLFSGGALTSGTKYDDVGNKRLVRSMCPPISLLGTALGDQILEGKMKVGVLLPICKELVDYTGIESEISFYDMLQEIFYTRRDDLKSNDFKINEAEKNENPVQMKYEMQCLSAGTVLVNNITVENDNDIDVGCLMSMLRKFKECPYIGGKSSIGHGEVSLELEEDDKANELIDGYYSYLSENKTDIRNWLRVLEAKL